MKIEGLYFGKSNKSCPICGYPFKRCQCCFGGSCHPDRNKLCVVVLDHLYWYSRKQIKHICNLESKLQTSYSNDTYENIRRELDELINKKR